MKIFRITGPTVLLSCLILLGCDDAAYDMVPRTFTAPQEVAASQGWYSVVVDWDVQAYACHNIYWNTAGGVTVDDNRIENVAHPFTHSGLQYGTTYYYRVSAANSVYDFESELSSEVSAAPGIPSTARARLCASSPVDQDHLGEAMAVSGSDLIVGTSLESEGAGAAYIFSRDSDGSWGIVRKLTASDREAGDRFGYSVAIDGDYAVVGAWGENGTGTWRGAAYLYYRNEGGPGNWGEIKKLTASDAQDNDVFGASVAVSADYVLIAAEGEDGSGGDRGAAYLFQRDIPAMDNWGEVTKLTASDGQDGDCFGGSVALSEDTAVVCAYSEDGTGSDRGAAYFFYRDSGGPGAWGEVTKVAASDPDDGAWFGIQVALAGDSALIGAEREDGSETDQGAAYLFSRDSGGTDNWGQVRRFTATQATDGAFFGGSVSVYGDLVLIGAPHENTTSGSAYAYHRNQGGTNAWGLITRLTVTDAEDGYQFGRSVAIQDGQAFVGATGDDGDGVDRGAILVY